MTETAVWAGSDTTATLVETRKGLTRKSIEQLGYIKDINSLVVLSGPFVSQVCPQVTDFPLRIHCNAVSAASPVSSYTTH